MEMLSKLLAWAKNFSMVNTNWLTVETVRTVLLLAFAVWLIVPDVATLAIIKYVFGFLVAIALISHVIRKLLFPYVDLRQYAKQAVNEPLSAAIVIVGFCIIISTLIAVTASFFQ